MEEQKSPKVGHVNGVGSLLILISAVFFTAIIVGGGVYYWQGKQIERQRRDHEAQLSLLRQSMENDADEVDETEDVRVPKSFITEIDENTNLYTNNEFGFSMEIPTQMYHLNGAMCNMINGSYRPVSGLVPVKVFEDGDSVFITSEYFYMMGGVTQVGSITNFSTCDKVMNTLALLQDSSVYQQQKWELVFSSATTDSEVTQFIKDRHGVGCEVDEQVASIQDGVFDIKILGDGLDFSESTCPINYRTETKYYPAGEIIVSWNTGQAYTFYDNSQMDQSRDDEMVASFQFE